MSPLTFTASTIVNPASSCWNSTRGGTTCFDAFAGAVLTGADDEHAATTSAATNTSVGRTSVRHGLVGLKARPTLVRGRIGPSCQCALLDTGSRRRCASFERTQRRGGADRSRRAICIAIDRAQESSADLRLRIAAGHQLRQSRQALL